MPPLQGSLSKYLANQKGAEAPSARFPQSSVVPGEKRIDVMPKFVSSLGTEFTVLLVPKCLHSFHGFRKLGTFKCLRELFVLPKSRSRSTMRERCAAVGSLK